MGFLLFCDNFYCRCLLYSYMGCESSYSSDPIHFLHLTLRVLLDFLCIIYFSSSYPKLHLMIFILDTGLLDIPIETATFQLGRFGCYRLHNLSEDVYGQVILCEVTLPAVFGTFSECFPMLVERVFSIPRSGVCM